MNKYRISKSVDIDKSTSKMGMSIIVPQVVAMAFPALAGTLVTGVYTLNDMLNKDVSVIATLDELNEYSCVDSKWNKDCIYIEHPMISKRLIESKLYKEYIIKDLMTDIFNYITDNIAVKKVVLGLETKGNLEVEASVPINEVVCDAKLSGSLDKNYVYSVEDVECTHKKNREHPWIKYYPDIVAAVRKNAGKLEIKQSVKMDLDVNLGIQGVLKDAFKAEKEYSFYVYYVKA